MKLFTTINKLDPGLVLVAFVLLFLARMEAVPRLIYFIYAIPLAIYFFPVKIFTAHWKEIDKINIRVTYFISFFLSSLILALSGISFYYSSGSVLEYINMFASMINILMAYYYFLRKFPVYLVALHFSISVVSSAAIFL
ncbi:MAG: hypothetical protein LC649_02275 [Bacteroidales bacterium]|nr:hypothetical protein [Bacteroidales bacterium]